MNKPDAMTRALRVMARLGVAIVERQALDFRPPALPRVASIRHRAGSSAFYCRQLAEVKHVNSVGSISTIVLMTPSLQTFRNPQYTSTLHRDAYQLRGENGVIH